MDFGNIQALGSVLGTPKFKIVTINRDNTLANGTQSITGVGFKPKAVVAFASINGTAYQMSQGFGADGSSSYCQNDNHESHPNAYWTRQAFIYLLLNASPATVQDGDISSWDSDGFTITWTKTGSPTGLTTVIMIIIG